MARSIHASSRRFGPISLVAVLACAVVSAHASLAATPTDPVTGLSLDFCASQDSDRTHSFQSTSGSNNGWQYVSYTCISSCTPTTLANCSHVFLDNNGNPLTYTRNGQ